MDNWINNKKINENTNKISLLMKNIENNSIELGKQLFEAEQKGFNNIYKEYMTKSKSQQLINNYIFCSKYNIVNMKLTLINILSKLDNKVNNKIMIDYIEKSKNMSVLQFKNYIKTNNENKVFNKNILFDEDMVLVWEEIKKKMKNEYKDVKINNQNIMKELLSFYYIINKE